MSTRSIESLDLLARLEKLERQNQWMKAGGVALLLVFAGVGILGAQAQKSKTLEAEKILLYDPNGKVRATLQAENDAVSLVLRDENERHRLGIGVNTDGPGIYLTDPNGRHRAVLARNNEGIGLDLLGENGKSLVLMHVAGGEVGFKLKDEAGNLRGGFIMDKDVPTLYLSDDKERHRALLRVDKAGAGLGLYDPKGKLFSSLPARKAGGQ